MRADNKGEGGTLALMALAQRSLGKRSTSVFFLGVIGAALFYGDGIITPAVSVLGALEGMRDAPGLGQALAPYVLPASAVILVVLFLVQSRGTASMARYFGPITLAWFVVLGFLGAIHISDDPSILRGLSPHYGVMFLLNSGWVGLCHSRQRLPGGDRRRGPLCRHGPLRKAAHPGGLAVLCPARPAAQLFRPGRAWSSPTPRRGPIPSSR